MKTTFEFLLRLLVFPFIFGLIFVKMMVETIKRSLGFLMYGGEWVNYNNSKLEKEITLQKIYESVKLNN